MDCRRLPLGLHVHPFRASITDANNGARSPCAAATEAKFCQTREPRQRVVDFRLHEKTLRVQYIFEPRKPGLIACAFLRFGRVRGFESDRRVLWSPFPIPSICCEPVRVLLNSLPRRVVESFDEFHPALQKFVVRNSLLCPPFQDFVHSVSLLAAKPVV